MTWGKDDPVILGPSGRTDEWGMSDEVIKGPRPQPTASLTQPPEPQEPLDPWSASWERLKGSSRTGVAGVTQALGWDEWTKELLGQAEGNYREADRFKPQVPSYKDIYKEDDLLGSVGRAGRYLYEGAAGSAANMGATIAGGALGAPLGLPGMIAGAIAANVPSYTGENLREQMEQKGVPFDQTNLARALPTAVAQAGLDTLPVGRLGLGKAATGGIASRVGKKAAEGAALEGATEATQEAMQIGQADLQKLYDLSPEIKDRLIEAGVAGAALGGTLGAGAGAARRRAEATTPQEEEPPGSKRGEDGVITEPVSPSEYFPPPREYAPAGTGLPAEVEQTRFIPGLAEPGTGLPEFTRNPEWQSIGEDGPRALVTKYGETESSAVAPTASLPKTPENNGQKVFDDIRQQLYAADVNPVQANAAAKVWKARYEALGQQLGISPFEAYKASNVEIKGTRKSGPEVTPTTDPATVLNQDPIEQAPQVVMRSALTSAANRIKMKEGTGQQWLNALKREGVKDEEIEWSGVRDFLNENLDKKMPTAALQRIAQPYKLAVYEAKPHDQGKKSHYGQWTLGEYGSNPDSNYREVVVSDESLPQGTYKSDHWQMVPNPLGHYRTTDRTLSNGQNALHMEEAQSDWHQDGRKFGYKNSNDDSRSSVAAHDLAFKNLFRAAIDSGIGPSTILKMTEDVSSFPESIRPLAKKYADAQREMVRINYGKEPAPYQQSWPNMLFRHALADAINQNKDVLTWNTGANMPEVEGWGRNADPKKIEAMQKFYDGRIVDYANKLGKPFGVQVSKQMVEGPVPILPEGYEAQAREMTPAQKEVWSLPINSAMREVLQAGGLPLFQRSGSQSPKGQISIMPDKSIIRLFETSDVSTVMHESAHHWLGEFERYAPKNKDIAQDLTAFKAWAGLTPDGKITTKEHELFARGYEQYLATGKAPNKALKDLFEQFRQWMIDIYKRIQNIQKARPKEFQSLKMTPEMRGVYDRMMAFKGEPEASSVQEGQPTAGTFQQAPQGRIAQLAGVAKKVGKNIFDPLSRVKNQEGYLDQRQLFAGNAYKAEQAGKQTRDLYAKLSPQEQEAITQFLTTTGADINTVPQPLRAQTRAVKDRILELGEGLVQRKMLSKEAWEANKDAYLPRLYLSHFLDGKGFSGGGMKANAAWAKSRDKTKSLEARTAMGEIRHPGVSASVAIGRLGRDTAAYDFLSKIAENPDWVHPRSTIKWDGHKVTPEWLKSEAAQVRKRAKVAREYNPDQAAEMIAIADKMDDQADIGLAGQDFDPKDWKQMPDTRQFGALRGAWVQKQIADDIVGMVDFVDESSWAARILGDKNSMVVKATQAWKSLKVPWNIASHGRNFAGNAIQMNFYGGVPIRKVPQYIVKAIKEIRSDGPVWRAAKEQGIPYGNMGEAEFRALADEVGRAMETTSTNGPDPILNLTSAIKKAYGKIGAANEWVTSKYSGMENIFKTAVMAHAMETKVNGGRGMPASEAARLANKALFDYSNVSPSVKYLRNAPLGMPFLVYSYKTIPMLAETLTTKEGAIRALPYLAMGSLASALAASMSDLKDDDPERLKMALSEGMRRMSSLYLLPWKDANGRWQFLDVGYFLPWQMPRDVATGLLTGKFDEAAKAANLFSSPVASVLVALKTGIDPFTDRPIADKRDPVDKQVWDITKYVWDLVTPSVLASYGLAGKAIDRLNGSGVNRYGEPPADWTQIAARGVGLNMYSVDPEAQRARNLNKMQHEIQDIRSRLASSLKDQSLTMKQRQELVEDFREKILDRTKKLQTYAKDSEMTPSLKAASSR